MEVEEFLEYCLKRKWHFTYNWFLKRYKEMKNGDEARGVGEKG